MSLIEVNDENFQKEVIECSNTQVVLVDFWAEWCGPCKALTLQLEKQSDEYDDRKIKFCKLNVDKASNTATNHNIRSIPTTIIFKNGKNVDQVIGADITSIKNKIDKLL